jgi:hypothetical protein
MKRILIRTVALGLLFLSGNTLFAAQGTLSPESQKQLKKLEAKVPAIYAQVSTSAENDTPGIDYENAVYNFPYLADTGQDIRQGMDMILQASFYQSKVTPSADQVNIDGDNTYKSCVHYALEITADGTRQYWAGSGWDTMAGPDIYQRALLITTDSRWQGSDHWAYFIKL